MIITSVPRSGSTQYCYELSEISGKQFVDEPFSELNQKILTFKKRYHECSSILRTLKPVDDAWTNRDSYIISNHNMILPLLESTDVFLTRNDLKGAMRSLWASLNKVFSSDEAMAYLKLYFSWVHNFLDYVTRKNITPLFAEDQGFQFRTFVLDEIFENAFLKSGIPLAFK